MTLQKNDVAALATQADGIISPNKPLILNVLRNITDDNAKRYLLSLRKILVNTIDLWSYIYHKCLQYRNTKLITTPT